MSISSFTNNFVSFMESAGVSRDNLYISDNDSEFDTVGFIDADNNGNTYDVTILIDRNNSNAAIYIKRELKKYNEINVLKFINELNKYFVNGCFYCEDKGKTLVYRNDIQNLNGDVGVLVGYVVNSIERCKEQSVKIDG